MPIVIPDNTLTDVRRYTTNKSIVSFTGHPHKLLRVCPSSTPDVNLPFLENASAAHTPGHKLLDPSESGIVSLSTCCMEQSRELTRFHERSLILQPLRPCNKAPNSAVFLCRILHLVCVVDVFCACPSYGTALRTASQMALPSHVKPTIRCVRVAWRSLHHSSCAYPGPSRCGRSSHCH